MNKENLLNCLQECTDCAIECRRCADACLKEEDVNKLTLCISLDLQCAAICELVVHFMIINSPFLDKLCHICADICDACAKECEKHGSHRRHCVDCALACRDCAAACRAMLSDQ